MSKMSELPQMIDTLIICGETLAETGRTLRAYYSSDEDVKDHFTDAARQEALTSDEKELIDVLIAISVVAKRLAENLRKR